MKKTTILTLLCVASIAAISVAHYYEFPLYVWTRLLIAAPIIYAGINFRRSGAISIAMLLMLAQGPLFVIKYARTSSFGEDHIPAVIIISTVSVLFGHLLRKERENSEILDQTHRLIQSVHRSIDEDSILSMLETIFAERGKSDEVATYLFGGDGALRPREAPAGDPLPPGHLFYTVAERREFMESANPAQDSRIIYYGPENELASVSRLAVFPLEYGGRVRGVISIANSADERFGKESVAFLSAIKQSVENTLDLGERLRDRIQHEIQRKKIRDTFSSYLSRTVAEEILKDPDRIDLGGEVRDVTVMFTEVTNFRELMKTVPPAELLARLNEYFSAAIDTIFEFDGTLDKFIGDNIMAFWGAPLETADSEGKAVACARRLHEKLARLNAGWERAGARPFSVCIGINSGPVVAGNIGSIRRMEYTVIGDTVNLASRIKSLSRTGNIPVLVSETTHSKTSGAFPFSEPFQAAIKGKSQTATVYRLLIENTD